MNMRARKYKNMHTPAHPEDTLIAAPLEFIEYINDCYDAADCIDQRAGECIDVMLSKTYFDKDEEGAPIELDKILIFDDSTPVSPKLIEITQRIAKETPVIVAVAIYEASLRARLGVSNKANSSR